MGDMAQPKRLPLPSSRVSGLLAVLLLTLALLPLRFPALVDALSDGRVLEAWYDGYKSYAVLAYHIEHDSSYGWYTGMNYPYGEHIVPAAGHPFFSAVLKFVDALGLDTGHRVPQLLHAWLLFGWLLAAVLLYLVLERLGLPVWYAVAGALFMVFLNPQTERLYAHFGLAQFYALPLLFYGLQRFEYRQDWASCGVLLLGITWLSGIHFYYFAILNIALAAYFFFSFLQRPSRQRLRRYLVRYAVIVLPPLLGFGYWIYLADPVTDRGSAPWGFLFYRAQWESVLLARELPLYSYIHERLTPIAAVADEGRAYVGIPAVLVTLYLLTGGLYRALRRRPRLLDMLVPRAETAVHRFLYAALYTGFVLLLLAFAFPFSWPGMEAYVEYAGPLRQFRSLGRFAWVFYYTLNFFALYLLYHWLRQRSRVVFGVGMGLLLAIGVYECVAFAQFFRIKTDTVRERAAGRAFTDIPGLNFDDYQAILPVPYFNVGVSAFGVNSGGFSVQKALTLGVQTGLPTTAAMLTRTSLGQTFRQRQLASEPYRLPVILADYPDTRPLLLTYYRKMPPLDRYRYDHLLEDADSLYTDGGLSLYALPLSTFPARIARRRAAVDSVLEQHATSTPTPSWWSPDSIGFGYESFDEQTTTGYRGAGFTGDMATPINIDLALPDSTAGRTYRSSFWLHSLPEDRANAHVWLEEWRDDTGPLAVHRFKADAHFQVFDPLGWTLVDYAFDSQPGTNRLRLVLTYLDGERGPVTLDEWLVHPADANLYRRPADGSVGWNNRYYE